MTFTQEGYVTETTLGAFIKARRLELGLSQKGMNSALGMSSAYLSNVERGAKPSEKGLCAIERILKCKIPRSLPSILPTAAGGEPRYGLKRKTHLAEQITRGRLGKRYTQARTAELAAISLFIYRQIEVGERTPSPREMKSISAVLELDLTDSTPLTPYIPTRLRRRVAAVQIPFGVGGSADRKRAVAGLTIELSAASCADLEAILTLSELQGTQAVIERSLMMMRRFLELTSPGERASLAS